jgi:hypothetical protein
MGRLVCRSWLALLVAVACPAARADDAQARQIAQWIEQLDADSFSQRRIAARQLMTVGEAAVEPLVRTAAGKSFEVTDRTMRILGELASSSETATAKAARAALVELAASKRPGVSSQARRVLRARQQRALAALEQCGAQIYGSDEHISYVSFDDAEELGANLLLLHELPDLERLSFSTELMDDRGLAELRGLPRLKELNLYRSRVGDPGMQHLKTMPGLKRVPMGETRVTDKGLVHLKDLTQLEYLGLRANQITDAGLVHLAKLTNLTGLYLGETKVTDAGLAHLKPLTKLDMLRLDQTQVTDAGLQHLHGLSALRSLDLTNSRVTPAGIARLKQAVPQIEIRTQQPR